tara:strand:+ start:796 stop:1134 length:339 start_codon:yes stop_codon:yes gene_type:complete
LPEKVLAVYSFELYFNQGGCHKSIFYPKAIITDIYDYFGLSDYCHDIGKNKGRGRRGILSKMEALALVKVCMGGLYEGRWVEGSALTGPYVKPLCHGSAFKGPHFKISNSSA